MPKSSGLKRREVNLYYEFTHYHSLWIGKNSAPCLESDDCDISLDAYVLKYFLELAPNLLKERRGSYIIKGQHIFAKTCFGITVLNIVSGDNVCLSSFDIPRLKTWVDELLTKHPDLKAAYKLSWEQGEADKIRVREYTPS